MTLAPYVRILGRGPGRSRSLTRAEAEEAMALMLSGGAAPESVGALLMLMRMKGETSEEIAGFAAAAQAAVSELPKVDLDWPCYAAGRSRGAPWFLLAARLVASAGYRVAIHGWNGADAAVRDGLDEVGIPVADGGAAANALAAHGIAYLPLEHLAPPLFTLLTLREVLGLRSCINTVCRMLNPGRAAASVQGVFHPSYRLVQCDAAALLGWRNLSVIKGGGGEFERHPGKPLTGFGLRSGTGTEWSAPALIDDARRLSDISGPSLSALWGGAADPFAEAAVIGTAALALDTLGVAAPEAMARQLWAERTSDLAA